MTTVLGLARGGAVWMAADSQVTLCDRPMPGAVRKILRFPVGEASGDALLGVAGDGALAGLARRFLKVAGPFGETEDDIQDFADLVAQGMSELARDHGVLEEGRMAGMLLLGWAGRVWTLVHSQAIPHLDGIAGVGSGSDAGLGALDALLMVGVEPTEAMVRAVQIAIGRDINSDGPVMVQVLEPTAVAAAAEGDHSGGYGAGAVVRAAQGAGDGGADVPAADPAATGPAGAGDRPRGAADDR